MTGADAIALSLKAHGVEWIATLCGHGLNSIYAACQRAGIRLIDTRNEQTAAYMAECWGRLSGQVGVCAVSSGVAHINALTGVANAHFDGAPMLLLSGFGAWRTAGMGHFQDMDQVAPAQSLCKYARVLDVPERIPGIVDEALDAALSGRPGPVHLTMPMDVQDAEIDVPLRDVVPQPTRRHPPAPTHIQRAADLLGAAQRPVLVAGNGAYYAGAGEALEAFAASFAMPFCTPIWDRGCAVEARPEFVGVVGAASGGPRLLEDADLVILLGAAADYRVGYLQEPTLAAGCRLIRVDVDPGRLHAGFHPDLAVDADPASFLEALHDECTERQLDGFEAWLADVQERAARFHGDVVASAHRGAGLHALDVMEAVEQVVPDDAVLVIDGGNVGQWFHQTLGRRHYSGLVLTCGASGVVGYGIAGAMAAKAGFPHRPVVLISGDGSSTFNIADLERAASQHLPFAMVVADDQSWGIVASGHRAQYGELMHCELGPIDFPELARSLSALGTRADDADGLRSALEQALTEDLPCVIHAPIQGGLPGESPTAT